MKNCLTIPISIRLGRAGRGLPAANTKGGAHGVMRPTIGNAFGFSLIEMMITVALLAFMIVGLVGMFVQTQRAFRGGMAQSDVLEAGRATTDLLARELEQISPTYQSGVFNFYSTNFPAFVQKLPGTSLYRTNQLGEFFFLTHDNQAWTGVGYVIAPYAGGVGTLYRYETNPAGSSVPGLNSFYNLDLTTATTNGWLHRVADGIIHLRVQAYTTNGVLLDPGGYYNAQRNIYVLNDSFGQYYSSFASNAVPAYVELELGVLEHDTLEKFKALPAGSAQDNYLKREQTAGRVHIFRRHIAVRNVDPTAYQ